jgi:light-regulated signal transduction histidine kinase (bacteriophytochrome)
LRFTYFSAGFEERSSTRQAHLIGKRRWEEPGRVPINGSWEEHKATLEARKPFRHFECARIGVDGRRHVSSISGEPMFDAEGRFQGYRGVSTDVTARVDAAETLKAAHDELARSNNELEQFAYVASHDLQEPLRMVSSYTQLLAKRHADRLDGDAKEFMGYVVDGAARMKQLIEDLLAYSRVGTRGREFKQMKLEAALARALAALRAATEESGAEVTHDPLPEVEADESQLTQLLQNLIGNAIKFRGAVTPRIHVSCISTEKEFEIAVRDNGIGIEPQYFERIFMVFQRLHDKGQYPGTGIGLAICKKVVDRHGGRLWVTSGPGSQPDGGSTFHFTLPKKRGNAHG